VRQQALTLGKVVGLLLETNNLPVMANAIAFAAGLDQLNGKMSQAQVARELKVTRALVSHYVVGVRDFLSGKSQTFDCTKFRKSNKSRQTFREKATDPFTAAKAAAIARYKASNHITTK
jgi:succinate dehydrogenase/fumarate reductase cytochrome b subunit